MANLLDNACYIKHMIMIPTAQFAHLHIVQEPGGTTLLIGQLPNQAALYGVLLTIRSLGLRLLSLGTSEILHTEEPDDSSPAL